MAKNIKPRKDDYAQWYLDVIKAAQLADYSPVKGCMVIRPEGYAVWEAIQRDLTGGSRKPGTSTPISRCSFRRVFWSKKPSTSKGLPWNSPW